MKSEPIQKVIIFLVLGLLTASAFFMRLDNFKKTKVLSIDEVVYFRMGQQVYAVGPAGYHTIPFGKELAAQGRELPSYFTKPLFKHPPVFTFLIALSMKLFQPDLAAAGYVSLFFGALLIPLTYVLGVLLFNRLIGLCAAIFLWMDPVSIMTSQKVWMDTTLTFFMLATVVFFTVGWKKQNNGAFLLSGLACALAVLTKYTGIFALLTTGLFAWVYQRPLFRNKPFLISLALPFAALLPWIFWNYNVYGSEFLMTQKALHRNEHLYWLILILIGAFLMIGVVSRLTDRFSRRSGPRDSEPEETTGGLTRQKVDAALAVFLVIAVFRHIAYSLDFNHIPRTSWVGSIFHYDPPTFYVAQLLEYSFIYFFAFASFFISRDERQEEISLLRYGTVITLVFFTLWKSFQCRYILFALPLLAILAFEFIFACYQQTTRMDRPWVRTFLKGALIFLIIFSLGKVMYINMVLSFPNDMCYF